jgi:hypothetical protein
MVDPPTQALRGGTDIDVVTAIASCDAMRAAF